MEGLQRRKAWRNSNVEVCFRFISTVIGPDFGDSDENENIDDCPYDDGGGAQSGIIEGRSLKARGSPCSNALTSHSLR